MTENQETKSEKRISPIVDDDKNTSLHYSAAFDREEDLIKDLNLEQKIDVANYLGWTPLMMACRNGHTKIVNLLLQNRADATKKNKFGMSAFIITITSGNLELINMILQHLLCGGVSRQSMQYIVSPLSIAILFCHQHILQYLIEQSFSLNSPTPITGITPLMFASAMENYEAFTLLIAKGADTTVKNFLGITAHDITQMKNRKMDMKATDGNQLLTPVTTITKSPHLQPFQQQVPYIVISPQPTFFQVPPNQMVGQHLRKSSNTLSPSPNYFFTTPNITPIPPVHYMAQQPQMFFPPEFSPSGVYTASPIPNVYNNSNDFLNARMNPNMILSPFPQAHFAPPCV